MRQEDAHASQSRRFGDLVSSVMQKNEKGKPKCIASYKFIYWFIYFDYPLIIFWKSLYESMLHSQSYIKFYILLLLFLFFDILCKLY